jgi:hypothetical protein
MKILHLTNFKSLVSHEVTTFTDGFKSRLKTIKNNTDRKNGTITRYFWKYFVEFMITG